MLRRCGFFLLAFVVTTATAHAQTKYFGVYTEAPPTSVHPQGWLKEMLQRQADGLGRHHAVSGYPYNTCLWAGNIPKGGTSSSWKPWWPYEQTGYLVDGLERLGLATGDSEILAEADLNLHYILDHPLSDGSLGPDHIGPTQWPQAVVFRALLAAYAAHPDPAIPDALRKHYLARPADFGVGRDVCNIEEILWTYAHTGDPRLLQLAQRTYTNFNKLKPRSGLIALADDSRIVEHGVTFNETAKIPALLYLYSGDRSLLAATLNAYTKIDRDHMLADGLHSCEEKLDGQDPWSYHETCDISDYTWSLGYALMATGDATWADHIEKAIFNAGFGSITKDFKAHQYFSSPNQIVAANGICDRYNPNRLAYRPGHDVECCSGNVHRFLPNFALRQWMMTADGKGVVAALYGPSTFTTTVNGSAVIIDEQTEYPFSDTITFTLHSSKPAVFSLSLRIPGWTTSDATLEINGAPFHGLSGPGSYTAIQRTFSDGDVLALHLPMPVSLHTWNHNGVSMERGPLVYSLNIAENATPIVEANGDPDFPVWDKRPASPWNYAIMVNSGADAASEIKVITRASKECPWDTGASPIQLTVSAKLITNWTLSKDGKNPGNPKNPQLADQVQTVTLVPYGSTCLRLTVFPSGETTMPSVSSAPQH